MPTSTRASKAAPAARKSSRAADVEPVEEDLFPDDADQADTPEDVDELEAELDADFDDDEDDLLDEIDEDDAEGWVPEEAGEGVSGTVLKVGETRSDFSDDMVPVVWIETKAGEKLRVIGYGSVLGRELRDNDPHPGDRIAVKYFGERIVRKGKWAGKPYRHFGVAIRRAPKSA